MHKSNRFVKFALIRFDAPIRFIYSQLYLNRLFFWKLYASKLEQVDLAFEEMKKIVYGVNYCFNKKLCLELGPGNSYISAYNFLLNGARKVILVDKYPRFSDVKKQKKQLNEELAFIKDKYNHQQLFFIQNGKIDNKYIELISKDLTEAGILEEIDFVYSNSVFEHIKDVEANIKKMSQLVKKGGLLYHSIDLRDHYNFRYPFLFLKYSRHTWEKYLSKEGVSYTNRLRYSEYKRLFGKYSLEIIDEKIKRFSIENISISKDFDPEDEDINIGIYQVLLIKK